MHARSRWTPIIGSWQCRLLVLAAKKCASEPINTGSSPARQLCTEKMHLDWTGSCCYTYCVDGSYRALGDLYLGICRITIMMWQFNHDSTDYGLPPVICLPENGLYYPQNGHQDLARMLIMITLPITYLRHLHHLVVTSSLGPMLRLACWLGYAARDTCCPPLWLHSTVNNCCNYC